MNPDDPRHGTNAGYSYGGCRQDCCRRAHARSMNLWRMGRLDAMIPALGTHRRIRALGALGWSYRELSRRLGHQHDYVTKMMRQESVVESTARKIADLYDQLSMTPAPTTPAAARIRLKAATQGWLPPLAWDDIDDPNENPVLRDDGTRKTDVDENVVIRVLAGESLPTTAAEKEEIGRRWRETGRPLAELARVTGWTKPERYGRGEVA